MVQVQGLSQLRNFGTLSTSFSGGGQGSDFMNCAWDFIDMANSEDPSMAVAQNGAKWIMSLLSACVPNRASAAAATKAKNTAETAKVQQEALNTNTTLLNNKSIIEAAMNAQLAQLKDIESFFQDEENKLTEKQQQIKENKEALEKLQQEYQEAETDDEKAKKLGEIQQVCTVLGGLQPEIDAIKANMANAENDKANLENDITNSNNNLVKATTDGQNELVKNVNDATNAGKNVAVVPEETATDATDLAAAKAAEATAAVPLIGQAAAIKAAPIIADRTAAISTETSGLPLSLGNVITAVTTIGQSGNTLSGLCGTADFGNNLITSCNSLGSLISPSLETVNPINVTPTVTEMGDAVEKDLAIIEENKEEDDNQGNNQGDNSDDRSAVLRVKTDDLDVA